MRLQRHSRQDEAVRAARAVHEEPPAAREAREVPEAHEERRALRSAQAEPEGVAPSSGRAARAGPEELGSPCRVCAVQEASAWARPEVCAFPSPMRAETKLASLRSTRPGSTSRSPLQRVRASPRGWLPTRPHCPSPA